MRWASGYELAEDIWDYFRKYVPKKDKKKAANKLLELFENYDCATLQKCSQLYYKDAERKDEEE